MDQAPPVAKQPAKEFLADPVDSVKTLTLIDRLGPLFTGEHLNASAGEQYSDKCFGRDSAVSAQFLLSSLKYQNSPSERHDTHKVINQVLRSLVRWQGQKNAQIDGKGRKNSEEPGRIHHQSGPLTIDLLDLVDKWQDKDDKGSDVFVYYGSVDATPLFVRLACEYASQLKKDDPSGYGAYTYLLESLPNWRGGKIRVCDAIVRGVGWIEGRLASSELGLLEYHRLPGQEQGLRNQVWKDSLTSFVHQDGELANAEKPIAAIEVQALAYDALTAAAALFEADPVLARSAGLDAEHTKRWRDKAQVLQQKVIEQFWNAADKHFASAIDRDPVTGQPRAVKTASSNELHLLNSGLLDSLDEQIKHSFIESLVRQLTSENFLTDIGIRCRSKAERQLISFADYHGSWVIWPWETHWIATGLRRQGFADLADELDKRLHNAFLIAGGYREFFIADPVTDVCYYRYTPVEWTIKEKIKADRITATNIPDEPQTWSVAAFEDIEATLSSKKQAVGASQWVNELQEELMKAIKPAKLLTDKKEIDDLRAESPIAAIDRIGGKAADALYYHAANSQPGGSPGAGT